MPNIQTRVIKKLFNTLLSSNIVKQSMVGKAVYQDLFERIHHLALVGMNIGNGASPELSGEMFAIEYIHQKLRPHQNITIFDVGANVGEYVLLLKKAFSNKTIIHCFEPSTINYHKLLINTEHFDNIKYHNFGFGSHSETVTLFSEKSESALASIYNRKLDHFNIEMNCYEEISLQTIDEFCEESSIPHIHFIKIDVEGHEIHVLEGAKRLMNSGKIDFIQFEFGGCNIDSKTYFQDFFYLLKDKYIIYRIVQDGLYKIDAYKESYEIFKTTNFLAERTGL